MVLFMQPLASFFRSTSLIGVKAIFSSRRRNSASQARSDATVLFTGTIQDIGKLQGRKYERPRINPITRCDAIGSWRGTSSGHVLVRMCHGYLIALPTLQRPLLLLSISRKGAQSFLAICFFAAGGASNLARAVRTCFRRCCNTVSSRSWS